MRELASAARTAVHDINNALSAIRCNAFLIQTDGAVGPDAKEAAGDILTAVARGERTTSELSPLARAHSDGSDATTLAELTTRTARPLRPSTPPPTGDTLASSIAAPEPAPGDASRTVLVVDDDHAVRRGVARSLRTLGLRVLEAQSSSQALELLARERIDLLLTDVVMPEQSGYDLAEHSSRFHPTVRIVFMSGYAPNAAPVPTSPGTAPVRLLAQAVRRRRLATLGRRALASV